jgi:hypothetical protein
MAMPRWLPPAAWGVLGLGLAWRWRRRGRAERLAPRLGAVAGACVLGLALSAVQVLPALEYAGSTARAADDRGGRVFGFCVEPYRAIEAVWPNVFGTSWPENRSWIQALPPAGDRLLWTPSLYLGGLTLVLALGAAGARGAGRPPWHRWLVHVAVVAALAAAGRFAGPLWLVRCIPGSSRLLGPHDPPGAFGRDDGFLPDGHGSLYGLLAATLPAFGLFRYPGKLTVLVAAAIAPLAGAGWDRLVAGGACARAPRRVAAAGLAATVATLIAGLSARGHLLAWLARHLPDDQEFGPVEPHAAFGATAGALIHGGLVLAAALALASAAPRRPRLAGSLALCVMALDLGMANACLVWTVPQAVFDAPSEAARRIDDSERARPEPGPFRVHRVEMRYPVGARGRRSPQTLEAVVAWKRDTLEPLFGSAPGLEQTLVEGILEADDYLRFFRSRLAIPPHAAGAGGTPVFAFARGGIDLWNSRYVIMSVSANGWLGADAGYERLAPPAAVVEDPQRARRWIERENWQLLRNAQAFPRAWVVHVVRVLPPIAGRDDPRHRELLEDLAPSPSRPASNRREFNLRAIAFVETDQPRSLAGYASRTLPGPAESVAVTRHEPRRVELLANLERPGLVVLADTYSPGWHLTIDGEPAPIYRTNRLMRGAAVRAGRHTLVYTYDPASFRIGAAASIGGLIAAAALVPWSLSSRRPAVGPSKWGDPP